MPTVCFCIYSRTSISYVEVKTIRRIVQSKTNGYGIPTSSVNSFTYGTRMSLQNNQRNADELFCSYIVCSIFPVLEILRNSPVKRAYRNVIEKIKPVLYNIISGILFANALLFVPYQLQ